MALSASKLFIRITGSGSQGKIYNDNNNIINNLFKVGVLNERLIAIKKLIKANYL